MFQIHFLNVLTLIRTDGRIPGTCDWELSQQSGIFKEHGGGHPGSLQSWYSGKLYINKVLK